MPSLLTHQVQICSYAQGYNIIRAKSQEQGWGVDLAGLARIWKVRPGRLLLVCVRGGGGAWVCRAVGGVCVWSVEVGGWA